jgi:hypothetical protein
MGITIGWDNEEKSVMRFEYHGIWSWEEFYKNIEEANQMMDTVNHPVVSIIDMRDSPYLPPNAAVHIRNVIRMSMSHNNSGISVFLKATRIIEAMIEVLRQVYPDILEQTEWLYCDTLEEAREIAQRKVIELHSPTS